MARPLRVVSDFNKTFIGSHGRPVAVFEITTRTTQGRFLIKPTRRCRDLVLGVFGRAQSLLEFELYGYAYLSNHGSLLVGVESAHQLSKLMCYVNSNIARELGRKEHSNWQETFWGRRSRAIPILIEDDLNERMKYLLANSTKEHLVSHPTRWPGAHCARAICEGTVDQGVWIDRSLMHSSGYSIPESEATTIHPVVLQPLPSLSHLSTVQYQAYIQAMCDEVAEEAAEERRLTGGRVEGVRRILRRSPHHKPRVMAKSPAPMVHCSEPKTIAWFKAQYRLFVEAYRDAFQRLQARVLCAKSAFPEGCVAPTTSYLAVGL